MAINSLDEDFVHKNCKVKNCIFQITAIADTVVMRPPEHSYYAISFIFQQIQQKSKENYFDEILINQFVIFGLQESKAIIDKEI